MTITQLIAALFSLTLFAFSSLQFNDPDPYIWVPFYVICALVPGLVVFKKFSWILLGLAVAGCMVEITTSAPGAYMYYLHRMEEPLMQAMNPQKPYIEEAREFLGALIALTMVMLSIPMARHLKKNPQ
jgi:hypothetical protein